jgi:hypothetical protein
MNWILKQFQGTRDVCGRRQTGRKCSASDRTEKVVSGVRKAVTRNLWKSVRRLARQIGIWTRVAWKICRNYLFVSVQNAPETAIVGTWNSEMIRFCEWIWISARGQFRCLECHLVLRWRMLPCGWLHWQSKYPILGFTALRGLDMEHVFFVNKRGQPTFLDTTWTE